MTDRELMQQALEALEIECKGYADKVTRNRPLMVALRERLAQQVERVECTRCGRILADVPPEPVVPDNFAARWRNLVSAVRDLP